MQSQPKKSARSKRSAAKKKASLNPLMSTKDSMAFSAPVASGRVRRVQEPRFTEQRLNGDAVIEHREYIADIAGSVAFASTTYAINPGLPGSFPWLSAIAQRYESYRFLSLDFIFETESPTSATGTLLLAVDFDNNDSAPVSKSQAMTYRSSVRSPPWKDCASCLQLEDLSKRKSYFTRGGSISVTRDINLYDTGNLYVCTQGQAGTTTIGELYVSYRVLLMTPQASPIAIGEAIYGLFSGTDNSAPFATVTGNLPATVVSSGTTTSVSTWTFSQPWEGTCSLALTGGTGFTGTASSGTASVKAEVIDVTTGAATASSALYRVSADIGQTFILTISNATITQVFAYFSQADV